MVVLRDIYLRNFDFWAGAVDTVHELTEDDLDILEEEISSQYPDGIGETELNDLFWHEEDEIAMMLGYTCWEDMLEERNMEEEDDE